MTLEKGGVELESAGEWAKPTAIRGGKSSSRPARGLFHASSGLFRVINPGAWIRIGGTLDPGGVVGPQGAMGGQGHRERDSQKNTFHLSS